MEHLKENGCQYSFPMKSPFKATPNRSESGRGPDPFSSDRSPAFTENVAINHTKKYDRKGSASFSENVALNHNKKSASYAHRIREHVRLGHKLTETVMGKLSVGAKIIRKGGRENIFRDAFGVSEGDKLLKASQCYLSTTAGPIAGILFVSTEKVAFCSERPIAVQSSGSLIRIPYKLSIPVKKIKGAFEGDNVNHRSHEYIEIVTQDNFEFWFMGFVRYEKAFTNLQTAISLCHR